MSESPRETPPKSNTLRLESNGPFNDQSIIDLSKTPDCRMSKNLSLIRSFSKYSPRSKMSNISNLARQASESTEVKVEEPNKVLEAGQNEEPKEELTETVHSKRPLIEPKRRRIEVDEPKTPEKFQNAVKIETEYESNAEWENAKANEIISSIQNKDSIVLFEHQRRKIDQLLSYRYFQKSMINRLVLTL